MPLLLCRRERIKDGKLSPSEASFRAGEEIEIAQHCVSPHRLAVDQHHSTATGSTRRGARKQALGGISNSAVEPDLSILCDCDRKELAKKATQAPSRSDSDRERIKNVALIFFIQLVAHGWSVYRSSSIIM